MKNFIFLFCLLCGWQNGWTQSLQNSPNWHLGHLVLENGQELSGLIQYDYLTDVVQLKNQAITKAFTAQQVQSFRFTEQSYGMLREFISCATDTRFHTSRNTFLEVVLKGPMPLLRKHEPFRDYTNVSAGEMPHGQPAFFDYRTGYAYFVLHENKLVGMKKFRRKILPMLQEEYNKEIQHFVKSKQLRIFELGTQIRIINLYNFLKNPMSHTASADRLLLAD
jgi:hypothetical protein